MGHLWDALSNALPFQACVTPLLPSSCSNHCLYGLEDISSAFPKKILMFSDLSVTLFCYHVALTSFQCTGSIFSMFGFLEKWVANMISFIWWFLKHSLTPSHFCDSLFLIQSLWQNLFKIKENVSVLSRYKKICLQCYFLACFPLSLIRVHSKMQRQFSVLPGAQSLPFDWRAEEKTSSTRLDVLPVATNTVKRKKERSALIIQRCSGF